MARSDQPYRDAPEPLSRLLERSDAVARELERARRRLDEMAERYAAEQPLGDAPVEQQHTTPPGLPDEAIEEPSTTPRTLDEPPAEAPTTERTALDERRAVADLAEHWVIRVPEASREQPMRDDLPADLRSEPTVDRDERSHRDDDLAEDDPSQEPSIDTGITLLQEAARRRLSDER